MTPNTFPYLGVQPLKGRVFTEDDARPGAAPVVVLDHGAWVEKFGGRDDVLGQIVTVGDTPRTIIGVMPPRFAWQAPDMWVPLTLRRGATPPDERRFWYQAHLAPGVTLAEASERMTAIAQRRAPLHPDEYPPQAPRGRARPAVPRRRPVQQRAVHAARRGGPAAVHRVLQRRQHAARAGDDA